MSEDPIRKATEKALADINRNFWETIAGLIVIFGIGFVLMVLAGAAVGSKV